MELNSSIKKILLLLMMSWQNLCQNNHDHSDRSF